MMLARIGSRWGGLAAVPLILAYASVAWAQASISTETQANLFYKIATYDENLPADVLRVGIAYPSTDVKRGLAIVSTFRAVGQMNVNGRRIEVLDVPLAHRDYIEAAFRTHRFYGVFVTATTLSPEVALIRESAKKYHVFTFAEDASRVADGLTAAIAVEADRRVIVLNMTAALEQDRKYDGNFIKACKVVK